MFFIARGDFDKTFAVEHHGEITMLANQLPIAHDIFFGDAGKEHGGCQQQENKNNEFFHFFTQFADGCICIFSPGL